jgi:hypothetical protein
MNIKLTVDGLQQAITNKPIGFNSWVLKAFRNKHETRTLKEFYTALMFCIANN